MVPAVQCPVEEEGSDDGDHPKSSKLNVDREEARRCESDREPEERGEIAEHGRLNEATSRSCNAPRYASAAANRKTTRSKEKYARTVADEAEPTWNWPTPTTIPSRPASVAKNPSRWSSSSWSSMLPTSPCRFEDRTVSDSMPVSAFGPSSQAFRRSGRPSAFPMKSGSHRRPANPRLARNRTMAPEQARGRPNYITDYLRPVEAGAPERRFRPSVVCLWRKSRSKTSSLRLPSGRNSTSRRSLASSGGPSMSRSSSPG